MEKNLVDTTFPMLHSKSQAYRPSSSGEEDFKGFTIFTRPKK